jgi:hypothetical protein
MIAWKFGQTLFNLSKLVESQKQTLIELCELFGT